MTYLVSATNEPQRCFDSIDDALSYALSRVCASHAKVQHARLALTAGAKAAWSYGFYHVEIEATRDASYGS